MNGWQRGVAAVTLLFTAFRSTSGQADTLRVRPLFTWRDAVLGGGFVIATLAIRPLDKRAEDVVQQPDRQKNRWLKKAAFGLRTIAAPGSVIIGVSMYATGRVSNNDHLAELGLHGTEALFIGEGVGGVLKDFFGRARPFVDTAPNPDNWQLMRGLTGDRFQSFPSGHSVAGFAAAAAVTAETSGWWPNSTSIIGPAMYGGAALVGLSRMYDNRHWASDVIMGAAIGTFAGMKVVRYVHAHPGNRVDKWLLNASVSPQDLGHVTISLVPLGR